MRSGWLEPGYVGDCKAALQTGPARLVTTANWLAFTAGLECIARETD